MISELERRLREAFHEDAQRARITHPDIPSVLRSQADATRVSEPHPGSTTVTLIDNESDRTQTESRRRWPIVAVAAAALVAVGVGGLVLATRDDDQTDDVPANQPTTVPLPTTVAEQSLPLAQPPVEFTACFQIGPEVQPRTVEQISLADGETTIERTSVTYQQPATDVSDPRLEGTSYITEDNDTYSGPGSDGLIIGAWTRRIENDDGAWQGSHRSIDYPDGTSVGGYLGPYFMIGEGAYEGLTAILTHSEGDGDVCPNARGYIIDGTIPSPTVQTGD